MYRGHGLRGTSYADPGAILYSNHGEYAITFGAENQAMGNEIEIAKTDLAHGRVTLHRVVFPKEGTHGTTRKFRENPLFDRYKHSILEKLLNCEQFGNPATVPAVAALFDVFGVRIVSETAVSGGSRNYALSDFQPNYISDYLESGTGGKIFEHQPVYAFNDGFLSYSGWGDNAIEGLTADLIYRAVMNETKNPVLAGSFVESGYYARGHSPAALRINGAIVRAINTIGPQYFHLKDPASSGAVCRELHRRAQEEFSRMFLWSP